MAYCDLSSLSLVNPSQTDTVQVTLEGLDRFGNVWGESTVSIPPMHRVSRFLSEFDGLLGNPPQALTGGTRIASTGPIAAGALLNLAPDSLPIDIPVTPLPMSNSTP